MPDLTTHDLPFRLNAVTVVDDGIAAIIANNIKMAAGGTTEILTALSAVDDSAMVVEDCDRR